MAVPVNLLKDVLALEASSRAELVDDCWPASTSRTRPSMRCGRKRRNAVSTPTSAARWSPYLFMR